MLYQIITSSKSSGIGSGLTYESDENIMPGALVMVPLRNKLTEGIVISETKIKLSDRNFDVKKIHSVLSDEPLLNKHHLKLINWLAKYYFCTPRQALSLFLPAAPWSELLPENEIFYHLAETETEVKGKKQTEMINYLKNNNFVSAPKLKSDLKISPETIRSLLKKGIIFKETKKNKPVSADQHKISINNPSLTELQQSEYEKIKQDSRPSLIFGITGSGKTEIYAKLIADCIFNGKQAILLVPEILLTEHCIRRFDELIDREFISVIHSRLSPLQRKNEWKKIRYKQSRLVIGSRSALFCPCFDLGLIVIDEEHEWTYKNEQTPRYFAKTTAEILAGFSGAKLVLGSATPSLESWFFASTPYSSSIEGGGFPLSIEEGVRKRGKKTTYHLSHLPNRYLNQALPKVTIIDLATAATGKLYPFSSALLEKITDRLNKGEQSILFLNRRGMASALMCLECRRRIVSPQTQLPFTVHHDYSGKPYLFDHISGLKAPLPPECPACKSNKLLTIGTGTQAIESILEKLFPQARILRMDKDTITHPRQMRLLLDKMKNNQADILIGTQSVVKGLDLPQVTLAVVLLADIGLSIPDFRSGERIFQLLTQLTGRSGRSKPGEVIIQTFRPEADEIKLAASHATEEYLNKELKLRAFTAYPPFSDLIRFICRGTSAQKRANKLYDDLKKKNVSNNVFLNFSPTLFGGGKIWHVLLRGQDIIKLLEDVDLSDVIVDREPVECV